MLEPSRTTLPVTSINSWTGESAQEVTMFVTKPENWGLIPSTHIHTVQGDNQLPKVDLLPSHVCMQTIKQCNIINFKELSIE